MEEVEYSRLCVREGVVMRLVGNELVLYDPWSDRAVLLDLGAAAVVVLCDGSRTVEEVVQGIERNFPGNASQAASEVALLVRRLLKLRLLKQA